MEREIIRTKDGSTTIHIKDWDECYHSKHGAIQEAQLVFIKNGLALYQNQSVSILEIGFGTGLNAFITYLESKNLDLEINYVGVEAYPVSISELSDMNYVSELNADDKNAIFNLFHESNWEEKVVIDPFFTITKRLQFFEEITDCEQYDLIYFDAFGYRVQPDLWSTSIFKKMHTALRPGGKLVTYAARGVVKRSMIEVGFTVEKLPGPPGKREMFRATKYK